MTTTTEPLPTALSRNRSLLILSSAYLAVFYFLQSNPHQEQFG